jgi:hypothetical protein
MDVAPLMSLLTPCLPRLMGLGQQVDEKTTEKTSEAVGEQMAQTERILQLLWPRIKARAAARAAAKGIVSDPTDEAALTVLRWQLKRILAADMALEVEVNMLLNKRYLLCWAIATSKAQR